MFLQFESHEERRNCGGSDFLEIGYAVLSESTQDVAAVMANRIEHWAFSSLYVRGEDVNDFCVAYGAILSGSLHADLTQGDMDPCGINYYNAAQTKAIISRLQAQKPEDYEVLLAWLRDERGGNGFYILGL